MSIATAAKATEWVGTARAARAMRLDLRTIRRMADKGEIRHRVLPGIKRYQFDLDDCIRVASEAIREPLNR